MLKRLIDITLTLCFLIVLSPLLIVLAILVYIKIGKPIFFKQRRPGKDGKVFSLLKFRTMTNQTDSSGELLPDVERLTEFGIFLRRASLDELPSLLNVLKGDMSLVGPRPLLERYLPLYSNRQRRRHEVRPGVTGWAQVNGRNAISWEKKFEYDVWYVDNTSVWLDFKILLLTLKKVVIKDGINSEGHATAKPFEGNDS